MLMMLVSPCRAIASAIVLKRSYGYEEQPDLEARKRSNYDGRQQDNFQLNRASRHPRPVYTVRCVHHVLLPIHRVRLERNTLRTPAGGSNITTSSLTRVTQPLISVVLAV